MLKCHDARAVSALSSVSAPMLYGMRAPQRRAARRRLSERQLRAARCTGVIRGEN